MSTIVTVIATDRDKAGTPNADITFSWCAEAPVRFVMTSGGDNTINIENTAGLVSSRMASTAPIVEGLFAVKDHC